MQSATTLRARVSPEAISKVTRIFNGTLDDIFNELLQNARRAGASAVAITTEHLADACLITVADDGAGIADPANLVSLGQSNWSDECRAREDPAGMGFFSLAGLDTVVSSCSETSAFTLAISGAAWTGEADIDVLPWDGFRGTRIAFHFPPQPDGKLERTIQSVAKHYPLPVILNGAELPQTDFLAGAETVIEREGYRIGVFRNVYSDHIDTINFHGLTLRHKLPVIKEVRHTQWSVKVDIVDAPELVLVLPARKEVFRNTALDRLIDLCREAIFAVIRQQPFHRLSFEDWTLAQFCDPEFPEAARQLPPWVQVCASDSSCEVPAFTAISSDAAIYSDDDACSSVTFARLLAWSRGEGSDLELHCLAEPRPMVFFAAVRQFAGYPWYDTLPHYTRTAEAMLDADGTEARPGSDQAAIRPERIVLTFADQNDAELQLETDFWIEEDESCWSDPDSARIVLTRRSNLDPGDLTELIIDAVFSPSDDSDADSYDTQETRFRHDAAVRAHEILEGADAATLTGIRMAFGDRIAWRIPHGRTLRLSWSSDKVNLELSPFKPARVQ
ncbi:ATP-binding protein [Sphingobium subterraneum]|uniref:ATP-binding protein n=1 Tax=Sphingobium subterraneum TaxID=627688 RepID=A0A841J4B2_9SPHN|nr:ATP-binding protein [Sphingobium subterraneum]MBB6125647.1 hypothetical protein [Sphingobium subterraneum]